MGTSDAVAGNPCPLSSILELRITLLEKQSRNDNIMCYYHERVLDLFHNLVKYHSRRTPSKRVRVRNQTNHTWKNALPLFCTVICACSSVIPNINTMLNCCL